MPKQLQVLKNSSVRAAGVATFFSSSASAAIFCSRFSAQPAPCLAESHGMGDLVGRPPG